MIKSLLLGMFICTGTFSAFAQLPELDLENTDHEWVNLEELKGEKLTVVDFWALWCKPCINSMPTLNKIFEELKDQGVQFIGVNIDGPRNSAKVKPFIRTIGIEYPIVYDPDQELVNEFNVQAFPTLIVFWVKVSITVSIGYFDFKKCD